ncbi:MAG: ribokinase [Elainellaceae cyanobacterium]
MSAIVFGSINIDLVTRTPRLPVPGETLTGHEFATVPGGKGANQAVAIARLGVPTFMVGRIGNDAFGQELLTSLQEAGVRCDRILTDASTTSGIAVIAVDDQGENTIILVPGANEQVSEADIERMQDLLSGATALLLQLEVPMPAVIATAQVAHSAGVKVILDPAPAPLELPAILYPLVDIITPNQVEASRLTGIAVEDADSAARAAAVFHQWGVAIVIIKLGRQGAFCSIATEQETEQFFSPAFPVKAVDTVAAGDAFNGGLAAALAEELPLKQAIERAAAVAALSVMKAGAQPSMPTFDEVRAFLESEDKQLFRR